MQIPGTPRAKRYFVAVGDRRPAGVALPKATPRTATDTPPRSALIPRCHSSSRSRSRSSPPDRIFARLGEPDTCAAATNSASGSCPDARGSRRGGCGRMPPRMSGGEAAESSGARHRHAGIMRRLEGSDSSRTPVSEGRGRHPQTGWACQVPGRSAAPVFVVSASLPPWKEICGVVMLLSTGTSSTSPSRLKGPSWISAAP